jgi:hypothetical protein
MLALLATDSADAASEYCVPCLDADYMSTMRKQGENVLSGLQLVFEGEI